MNIPNRITFIRIFLIPVFVALFLIDFPFHYLYADIVFVVASFSDFLDGYLARKLHLVTDLGKFLDPLADKALVCTALLLVCSFENSFTLFVVIAAIVIIVRELMITAFRTVAANKDVVLAADFWGKIKTFSQMVGLILYIVYPAFDGNFAGDLLMYGGLGFLAIATLFAVISAIHYLVKNKSVLSNFDPAREIISLKKGRIAVAESFTGGNVSAKIVKIPGASKFFVRGIVCYSNESKISDLGVSPETIEKYGAVSAETAEEMVKGILLSSKAEYAVATTGNAGPTAEKDGEIGVCYVAVADKKSCKVERYCFSGNRNTVISSGTSTALNMLLNLIKN